MKIYLIDKNSKNKTKLVNLGGKITFAKIDNATMQGNTILLRDITNGMQTDYRIRRVKEETKKDRGFKTLKAFYVVNIEIGKEGFDSFYPKKVSLEQTFRFHSLERAINMLEAKQGLKRADWVIG